MGSSWNGTNLEVALEDLPELLALDIGRIVDLQVSTLCDDLLGGVGALGVSPAVILPPGLDGLNILLVLLVLVFEETHGGVFMTQ